MIHTLFGPSEIDLKLADKPLRFILKKYRLKNGGIFFELIEAAF